MRKKLTGFLAVFACLLMLSACGGTAQNDETQVIPEETMNALYSNTEMTVQQMDVIAANGLIEEQKDYAVIYAGIQSWVNAKDEIGNVDFTTDADGNGSADCFTDKSITVDDEGNYVVTLTVAGDQKTADCVVSYNKELTDYVHVVTNVNYSFNELLGQAGMNTLLGMGTTFAVLILLSLIIACFGRIFTGMAKKKQEAAEKKEREAASVPVKAAAPAPVEEKQEPSAPQPDDDALIAVITAAAAAAADDNALIAVITAAVAAYRAEEEAAAASGGFVPSADPNEFVVRKIRRIGRK